MDKYSRRKDNNEPNKEKIRLCCMRFSVGKGMGREK